LIMCCDREEGRTMEMLVGADVGSNS